MKRTDELANVNQVGDVIDNVIDADPWEVVVKDIEPESPQIDMGYLVDNWGADLVFEVSGGNLPTDKAGFETLAEELREQYPRDEVF